MRVVNFIICASLLLSFSYPAFSAGKATDMYVFAAASTTDVVNDAISLYVAKKKLIIKPSYGGSGALAKQILSGASTDVFISANREWIDFLKDKDMLIDESINELARGRLVLVSQKHISGITLENISEYLSKNGGKVAIGDPKYVPAGSYAMQVFDKLSILDNIKKNLIYSNSVRTALNYVKLGEVEFAIVYLADVFLEKDKFNIYIIDENLHTPIKYWIAIIKGKDNAQVRSFYDYLGSKEVAKIFKKYGY